MGVSETEADPRQLLEELDSALQRPGVVLALVLSQSEARRERAADALRSSGRPDLLASLRMREAALCLLAERPEEAFQHAHEAFRLIGSRARPQVRALLLTQVAACHRARGDLRGALRAARTAEALLVSSSGEALTQVVAVRAQLVRLLRLAGQDVTGARRRLVQSYAALGEQVRGPGAEVRYRLIGDVFVSGDDPPHWALAWLCRWRNLGSHADQGAQPV